MVKHYLVDTGKIRIWVAATSVAAAKLLVANHELCPLNVCRVVATRREQR
jgi:hypothetical protein